MRGEAQKNNDDSRCIGGELLLFGGNANNGSHWWDNGITSIDTVFVDRGGKHYDIDVNRTSVISINGRGYLS